MHLLESGIEKDNRIEDRRKITKNWIKDLQLGKISVTIEDEL